MDGEFIRHVGIGVLFMPIGIASSAFDELVVALLRPSPDFDVDDDDDAAGGIAVFNSSGDLVRTVGPGGLTGVWLHHGAVVVTRFDWCCLVLA